MKRHAVTERELNEWLCRPQWQTFASSYGEGSSKCLEVDCTEEGPVFRVVDHDETVFLGAGKAEAIAAYNAAR